jgi:hypothetical protein
VTADQRKRAVATSGAQKDLKIQRFDQIPTGPLAELAARYGIGDIKYGQKDGLDNWRHGMPWSWSYRALIGHANDFWAGENVDEMSYLGTDDESAFDEDGEPRPGVLHLAAVMWHAAALIEWLTTHPENDARPSTVQRRLAAGLAGAEGSPSCCEDDEADDEDDFTGPPVNPKAELEIFDKVTWKFDSETDKAVYTVIGVTYDFAGKKFRYDITSDRSGIVRRAIPVADLTLQ